MTLFSSVQFSSVQFSSVQSLSHVQLFATPWTAVHQASLNFITSSQNLFKLMSIELMMPSNHLIPVVPFSFGLQSFPASGSFLMSQFFASGPQRVEFQLQHQSFQSIFRMISLRIYWSDILAVQEILC